MVGHTITSPLSVGPVYSYIYVSFGFKEATLTNVLRNKEGENFIILGTSDFKIINKK